MKNLEITLIINDKFYKITLDRNKQQCFIPGNIIKARLKIKRVNTISSEPDKGFIENIVEECLKTIIYDDVISNYVYLTSKIVGITEYKIIFFIDSYIVNI